MKKSQSVQKMAMAGVFAALILVATFITKIYFPGGYVHLGDTFIYLAACFLPTPYAMAAAAIGAGLADFFAQVPQYIFPTIVIKSLMACWFVDDGKKIINMRNSMGTIAASIILVGGYYLADVLITGNLAAPVVYIPFNAIQAVFNTALFFIIAALFDKMNLKNRLTGQGK